MVHKKLHNDNNGLKFHSKTWVGNFLFPVSRTFKELWFYALRLLMDIATHFNSTITFPAKMISIGYLVQHMIISTRYITDETTQHSHPADPQHQQPWMLVIKHSSNSTLATCQWVVVSYSVWPGLNLKHTFIFLLYSKQFSYWRICKIATKLDCFRPYCHFSV